MRKRLYVLCKLPTPYHEDFFRALHETTDIDLRVYYLWRGSQRRPWKAPLKGGYPHRFMEPRLGVDLASLNRALNDRESLFIVADWAHAPPLALILARLLRGAPVALWVDTPQEHLPRPFWKRAPRAKFLNWLLRRVDVTFGSGSPARRVLIQMGARPESIVDLQFLVDLDRPRAARTNREATERARDLRRQVGCENGTVFVMSGQIDLPKKGQDLGLRAFARVAGSATEPVGLLIAGTGDGESELKHLAHRLSIGHSVAFLGWQEAHEMDAVYLAADVLLHPAHYDPFPLVVMEAMSFGRLVVGSQSSGSVEERVRDGINGYSFPPGDVDALVDAMKRVVDNPPHRESLKAAARETAETWPVARGINVVREVMERLLRIPPEYNAQAPVWDDS